MTHTTFYYTHHSDLSADAYMSAYRRRRVDMARQSGRTLRDDDEATVWDMPVPLPGWARVMAGIFREQDLPRYEEVLRGDTSTVTCPDVGCRGRARIEAREGGGSVLYAEVDIQLSFRGIPVPEPLMYRVVKWLFESDRRDDEAYAH